MRSSLLTSAERPRLINAVKHVPFDERFPFPPPPLPRQAYFAPAPRVRGRGRRLISSPVAIGLPDLPPLERANASTPARAASARPPSASRSPSPPSPTPPPSTRRVPDPSPRAPNTPRALRFFTSARLSGAGDPAGGEADDEDARPHGRIVAGADASPLGRRRRPRPPETFKNLRNAAAASIRTPLRRL